MSDTLEALRVALGERAVVGDRSLARMTTLRVGGPAEAFAQVKDRESLARAIDAAAELDAPVTLIGLGSNVVVPDHGVTGLVLRLAGDLADTGVVIDDDAAPVADLGLEPDPARVLWRVGAGAVNAHVVRDMHANGLVGAEFLALVPGTIGGAVVMNAGTRWGELSERVVAVEVLVPGDRGPRWLARSALDMRYRHTALPPGAIVVGALVALERGDTDDAGRRVAEEKAYRSRTQPYKLATNGSVFANPPGDAAGRLIDAAGLKGTTDGAAVISEVHANWIVNRGGASASSVIRLMAIARRTVLERFGVALRPEVKLLGSPRPIVEILEAMS